MKCEYCDCQVTPYPASGICPFCGAKLGPEPQPKPTPLPAASAVPRRTGTPVYRSPAPSRPVVLAQPGINCCPRCVSTAIHFKKRGFGWVAGLIGFFFLPPFGLLFGLIGRRKLKYTCSECGHKWTRA